MPYCIEPSCTFVVRCSSTWRQACTTMPPLALPILPLRTSLCTVYLMNIILRAGYFHISQPAFPNTEGTGDPFLQTWSFRTWALCFHVKIHHFSYFHIFSTTINVTHTVHNNWSKVNKPHIKINMLYNMVCLKCLEILLTNNYILYVQRLEFSLMSEFIQPKHSGVGEAHFWINLIFPL